MRVETLKSVPSIRVKQKADDAVRDGAVKFEATKNANSTWTVKTTFKY